MQQQQGRNNASYGAMMMSKQHLPEEDDALGLGIVIGTEYSEPIKLSPDFSLAPTEDSSFT